MLQRSLLIAVLAALASGPALAQTAPKAKSDAKAESPAPTKVANVSVNGVAIPQSRFDVMNAERAASGQPDSQQIQDAIKQELIDREIVAQAAQKAGLERKTEVSGQLDMARQAILVRAFFADYLQKNPVQDKDLQNDYEEFKKTLGSTEYKARHVLVEKEEDAKTIIEQLNKGGDFAAIAKEKTKDLGSKENGGDLDWGPPNRYVQPFADALKALTKGKYTTAPVKTQYGFHVIKLDDTRPLQPPPFDQVKANFMQRAQARQIEKLVGDLRGKATVKQ